MTCKWAKLSFQQRTDIRSNHHCCVPFCIASTKSNSYLSFHTFPKDTELQKQWAVKIRRDHFIVTNTSRVCSRHFVTADMIEPPLLLDVDDCNLKLFLCFLIGITIIFQHRDLEYGKEQSVHRTPM
ncbi:hypothetical protein AMECASPLE_031211 [Ameca splendens]|uniref:THAP domain-containing protein 1 n=1 Tax=Ameca splendens TaxID=208324 RepID=A0ABV0XV62_9TELE